MGERDGREIACVRIVAAMLPAMLRTSEKKPAFLYVDVRAVSLGMEMCGENGWGKKNHQSSKKERLRFGWLDFCHFFFSEEKIIEPQKLSRKAETPATNV